MIAAAGMAKLNDSGERRGGDDQERAEGRKGVDKLKRHEALPKGAVGDCEGIKLRRGVSLHRAISLEPKREYANGRALSEVLCK